MRLNFYSVLPLQEVALGQGPPTSNLSFRYCEQSPRIRNITDLIARRKEEKKKELADLPPSEVGKDLCSTGPTFVLFGDNFGESSVRRGGASVGLSADCDATLSGNRRLKKPVLYCGEWTITTTYI